MSKRRGMSKAEKRQRLQAIFFDEKSPFTLKELEKMGSKQGIVSQSIKEVLQELVDDNLVKLEKIGIANYYWSFPSQATATKKKIVKQLDTSISNKKQNIDNLEKEAKDVVASEINEARTDAANLIERTNKELEAQKSLALQQLETQVDELSQLIKEKLLGKGVAI